MTKHAGLLQSGYHYHLTVKMGLWVEKLLIF